MNHLLMSAAGSTTLRASMLVMGYLAAKDEAEGVPFFLAYLIALALIGWQAERASLNGWHRYKQGEGDG